MSTHDMAQQLAFYRTSAPPHIGYSWKEFKEDTGLPSGLVDKLEEGTDTLLQTGFDKALDELIRLVTNNKYNLTNVRNAPLNVRMAIVKQAHDMTQALGGFAAESLLLTTQDKFYTIAGSKLSPKYAPQLMCCDGANSYAQVLERLKKLSPAVKSQIVIECFSNTGLGSISVGKLAESLLVQGGSEPVVKSTPVKPLTTAEKALIIQRVAGALTPLLWHYDNSKYLLNTQAVAKLLSSNRLKSLQKSVKTLRSSEFYKAWKANMDLRKKLTRFGTLKGTNQKQTLSTGMKWATGILSVMTIGGVIYLMSDN